MVRRFPAVILILVGGFVAAVLTTPAVTADGAAAAVAPEPTGPAAGATAAEPAAVPVPAVPVPAVPVPAVPVPAVPVPAVPVPAPVAPAAAVTQTMDCALEGDAPPAVHRTIEVRTTAAVAPAWVAPSEAFRLVLDIDLGLSVAGGIVTLALPEGVRVAGGEPGSTFSHQFGSQSWLARNHSGPIRITVPAFAPPTPGATLTWRAPVGLNLIRRNGPEYESFAGPCRPLTEPVMLEQILPGPGAVDVATTLTGDRVTDGRAGTSTGGRGDPDAVGVARVQVGPGWMCASLAVVGLTPPLGPAELRQGAIGEGGREVVQLPSPGADGRASGCQRADPAVTADVTRRPDHFYVVIGDSRYPRGAVRGNLRRTAGEGLLRVAPLAGTNGVAGAATLTADGRALCFTVAVTAELDADRVGVAIETGDLDWHLQQISIPVRRGRARGCVADPGRVEYDAYQWFFTFVTPAGTRVRGELVDPLLPGRP